MSQFMNSRYNFAWDDMVILTDDQKNPAAQPTRANILRAMQWLVGGAQPNDNLFLHFSGHGGQTEDLDGDEEDGMDETIYPVDFKQAGMIVDDEIHWILVRPLPPGCRLTAIFDCCHSGSVMDLPYEYVTPPRFPCFFGRRLTCLGIAGDVEGTEFACRGGTGTFGSGNVVFERRYERCYQCRNISFQKTHDGKWCH